MVTSEEGVATLLDNGTLNRGEERATIAAGNETREWGCGVEGVVEEWDNDRAEQPNDRYDYVASLRATIWGLEVWSRGEAWAERKTGEP